MWLNVIEAKLTADVISQRSHPTWGSPKGLTGAARDWRQQEHMSRSRSVFPTLSPACELATYCYEVITSFTLSPLHPFTHPRQVSNNELFRFIYISIFQAILILFICHSQGGQRQSPILACEDTYLPAAEELVPVIQHHEVCSKLLKLHQVDPITSHHGF